MNQEDVVDINRLAFTSAYILTYASPTRIDHYFSASDLFQWFFDTSKPTRMGKQSIPQSDEILAVLNCQILRDFIQRKYLPGQIDFAKNRAAVDLSGQKSSSHGHGYRIIFKAGNSLQHQTPAALFEQQNVMMSSSSTATTHTSPPSLSSMTPSKKQCQKHRPP